jgi:hypothetical protein
MQQRRSKINHAFIKSRRTMEEALLGKRKRTGNDQMKKRRKLTHGVGLIETPNPKIN